MRMSEEHERYGIHLLKRLAEHNVPKNLWPGIVAYLVSRRPTGSMLAAVFSNNLYEAVLRYYDDTETIQGLKPLIVFLHSCVPPTAFGSTESYESWLKSSDPTPVLFD